MEVYERIKQLRKKHLKLTQDEFGKRLGVSRDVIGNMELNRLARPEQKLSLIKLMCSEFNVNEDWILNGSEPIFIQTPSSIMEQLQKEFDLDEFGYNLVYEYLKLNPEQRKFVRDVFYRVVKPENTIDYVSEAPQTPEELEELFPPVRNVNDSKTG